MADQAPAPQAAASSTDLSFEDALALLEDEAPQEATPAPKAKAPAKEEPEADNSAAILDDPDEVTEPTEEETEAAPVAADDLKDETVVDLGDGKTATLADLKLAHATFEEGKVAQTRVMQEVATERSNLHTLGANMAQALENVSQYLVQRLPAEPDAQLAYTDPAEHYRQTILRNNAIAELQDMLAVAQGSKQAVEMLSEADFKAAKAEEDQKWIATMPALKDPKRFSAADAKAKAHALAMGWPKEEVDATADHKLRTVFFEAARYREIMANASKAKGKVENASIMPAPKARQHPNSQAALTQVNGLKKLAKTGRLDDALKLDW